MAADKLFFLVDIGYHIYRGHKKNTITTKSDQIITNYNYHSMHR